jgi:hypothetical protein
MRAHRMRTIQRHTLGRGRGRVMETDLATGCRFFTRPLPTFLSPFPMSSSSSSSSSSSRSLAYVFPPSKSTHPPKKSSLVQCDGASTRQSTSASGECTPSRYDPNDSRAGGGGRGRGCVWRGRWDDADDASLVAAAAVVRVVIVPSTAPLSRRLPSSFSSLLSPSSSPSSSSSSFPPFVSFEGGTTTNDLDQIDSISRRSLMTRRRLDVPLDDSTRCSLSTSHASRRSSDSSRRRLRRRCRDSSVASSTGPSLLSSHSSSSCVNDDDDDDDDDGQDEDGRPSSSSVGDQDKQQNWVFMRGSRARDRRQHLGSNGGSIGPAVIKL